MTTRLDARFLDAFHAHMSRDPNRRAGLGIERDLGRLPDPSLADLDRALDEARGLLSDLDGMPRDEFSFDDRLDLDLARLALEAEIERGTREIGGRRWVERHPAAGGDVGGGLLLLMLRDTRPDAERLEDAAAKLEAVPEYLEALLGRLHDPVARWVEIDLEKTAGLPTLFGSVVEWARSVAWPDERRLAAAVETASEALSSYADRVRALPTTREFHVGEERARRIVGLRGIELSLEELHATAREFLAENAETIEGLRARLAPKLGLAVTATVEEVERTLHERYRVDPGGDDFEGVLDRYRSELERVVAWIEETELFPIPDDQEVRISRTPPFLVPSIPAGAMMSPAPFGRGTRRSLVYLTLSRDLLDEHTELGIPTMIVHEGIPGHHLQLTFASMHPSVVRRHVSAMDQAEGWTTMMEDYVLDQGYLGERTDEARFVAKREIARLGARVAIDLFFMTGERAWLDVGVSCDRSSPDAFEAAGSLLRAVTGFVPARARGELNWYSQQPGYPLSYLTGNRLARGLRRDFELAHRDHLSGRKLDRAFHDAYLESGSMPLSFLRRSFAERGLVAG